MPYYIMLRDREGVSGVWSTASQVEATRWGLELSLTYPGCGVVVRNAPSFAAFKAMEPSMEFGTHEAESLDERAGPRSDRHLADAPLHAVG